MRALIVAKGAQPSILVEPPLHSLENMPMLSAHDPAPFGRFALPDEL
jgi:hypothetical protein